MANTYTQIHLQFVFAVKYRQALIDPSWKERLHQYITGIIRNDNHKMLAINSMPDHIHILVGFRPEHSISQLMNKVKSDSSQWINKEKLIRGHFQWQSGYGAFSYSKAHVERVINYILRQEEHHRKKSFLEEYIKLLEEYGIEYDKRYLFKDPE
ncbi:MAG TPA: IS200/IS605 family transposase [Flavobacterium sp.]|nr:IS200/IS605 family transposase [Flavobacterium sp.]